MKTSPLGRIGMLYLYDRHRVLSPAGEQLTEAAIRCFQGVGSSGDERDLQRWLNDARDQSLWVACDCLGQLDSPPLMSVRRINGNCYLVRHGAKEHAKTCVFHDPEGKKSADQAHTSEAGPFLPFTGDVLTLGGASELGDSPDKKQARSRQGQQSSSRERIPSIGRILLSWLHEAGVNRLSADEIVCKKEGLPFSNGPGRQFKKLDCIWAKTVVGDLTLGDITCNWPSKYRQFLARFRALEPRFPSGCRPQGFVAFVVDRVSQENSRHHFSVQTKRGTYTGRVFGRISRYGQKATKGPYYFIGRVSKLKSTGRYEVTSGYVHPVFARSLPFPVDSDFEREVGAICLDQVHYWGRRHGLNVEFEKPLFDERLDDDEWVRPDFALVLSPGKRVIVEALGYPDNEAYVRRKVTMEALLRSHPGTDVLSWSIEDQGKDNLLRRLLTAKALSLSDSDR